MVMESALEYDGVHEDSLKFRIVHDDHRIQYLWLNPKAIPYRMFKIGLVCGLIGGTCAAIVNYSG